MSNSISITVSNMTPRMGWVLGIEWLVFTIWVAYLHVSFNWISLIVFVILLVLAIAHWVIIAIVPTVVTADSEQLQYRNYFCSRKIFLTEIKALSCEQYSQIGKGYTTQHVKLVVSTFDGKDMVIHDAVDTSCLVSDFINKTKSDIPIVQLYNFLKTKKAQIDKGEIS